MSKIIKQLVVNLDDLLDDKIKELHPEFSSYRILRKSVDARRSTSPHFLYQIEVFFKGEIAPTNHYNLQPIVLPKNFQKPVIIGAGPAGFFAALRFVEKKIPCVLIERGSDAVKRLKSINRFWRYGELSENDNVCFGEGGAGLYSDGKLITRIKSPHIKYVMNRLVKFGAPEEIEYLSNPHVGSDRIRRVIPKLREFLLANGCEIHFNTQFSDLVFSDNPGEQKKIIGLKTTSTEKNLVEKNLYTNNIILATGHSAEDVFPILKKHNVFMEGKSFAMGLRIEHPQSLINKIQYRSAWEHPKLGAANYKLAHHDKEKDIGVYSFCMCPGGYVISSGTKKNSIVCNGMSNYHRNGKFANSAVVVSIDYSKLPSKDIFAGLEYRNLLETKAFQMSIESDPTGKALPAQKVVDFINQTSGDVLKGSSPSGAVAVRLDKLFPEEVFDLLVKGLLEFNKKMPGFSLDQAQLYGIESRTSCPVRITRDKESLQSLSHQGLYPTGEGAGYAGGITSAAVDGIRVAESIIATLEYNLK